MKALLVVPVLLALGACQTAGTTGGPATAAVVRTKIDTTIAKSAQQLADQCVLVQTAVDIGYAVVSNPKVHSALAKASPIIRTYCSGPVPVDIPTALLKLAEIYRTVMQSVETAKAV